MKRRTLTTILIAGLGIAMLPLAGCQSNGNDQGPTTRSSATQPASENAGTRYQRLRRILADIDQVSTQLPGERDADHRKAMASLFGMYADALMEMEVPDHTTEFDQQLRIIRSASRQLASGSPELAIGPTIDDGLRSVYNALDHLTRDEFGDAPTLGANRDALRQRLAALDMERGSLHRVVATEFVRTANTQFHLLADTLAARIGQGHEAPPTTAQ